MKKYYFLSLLCCMSFAVMAQSTLGGGASGTSTICYPQTGAVLYDFQVSQGSSSSNLDSLHFTTTGTYGSGDITHYHLMYNTINNLSTATAICTLGPSGTGLHTCTAAGGFALTASLAASSTSYFWITADVPTTATAAHTIAVSSILSSAAFVHSGSTTGFAAAGSTQTLNPTPSAITSSSTFWICSGSCITVGATPSGGVFTSGTTSVASVSGGTTVCGLSSGNSVIDYTIGGACSSTATVTVGTSSTMPPILPATPLSVCVGSCISLSDSVPGGSWSESSVSGTATVSSLGVACGTSYGNVNITYTVGSCSAVTTVTVNPLPAPISIIGSSSLCAFNQNSIKVYCIDTPGTWSSTDVTVTLGLFDTGIVAAPSAPGTSGNILTYTLPTGCYVTKSITVSPLPAPITGCDTVCASSTCTMVDTTAGGTWASSTPDTASVTLTTGVITGLSHGSATITYALTGTGCYSTNLLYVYPFGPIIDSPSICVGVHTTCADIASGGVWSTGPVTVATITPTTGVITGLMAGLDTVYYNISAHGCHTWDTIRVKALPDSITGPTHMCASYTITLSDLTTPGTWSTASATISDINASNGVDTGNSAGSTTISYTSTSTHCVMTRGITVNALPPVITGRDSFCNGATDTLHESGGGTWTIQNGHATITFTGTTGDTCVITGASAGVDTVYCTSASTGCPRAFVVTVNPLPATITGTLLLCNHYSTTLSDGGGGTWQRFGTGVTITSGGVVNATAPGNDSIVYTLSTGCATHAIMTVNSLPAAITGTFNVCVGSTILLGDASPGISTPWSAANGHATVTSGGVVTGVSGGTDSIGYTGDSSCTVYAVVTVNPLPGAITSTSSGTGTTPFNLCTGSTITLGDTTIGGTWYCSPTSVATVDPTSGVVRGISGVLATAIVTYNIAGTGCYTTHSVTVNSAPGTISGLSSVCVGSCIDFSDTPPGGYWGSSSTLTATISPFLGVVCGVSSGVATITYTTAAGCFATKDVTVNPIPTPILTSALTMCANQNGVTLSDSALGGTWGTSTPSIASVTSITDGPPVSQTYATASAAGLIVYTYSFSTGCSVSITITVNPAPDIQYYTYNVCVGDSIVYWNTDTGGTWTSVDYPNVLLGHRTITAYADSQWLIGESAGTWNIAYQLLDGCVVATAIVVNPIPASILVGTTTTVCVGDSILFSDPSSGGNWTATNSNATIDGLGEVTGAHSGLDTIYYSYPIIAGAITACGVSEPITVNPLTPIYGPSFSVCSGSTITLTDTTGIGSWGTSDGTLGADTVIPGTSTTVVVVTGGSVSTSSIVTITDTILSTGCVASAVITVNPIPTVILGGDSVCVGGTLTLTDEVGPGVWSSSYPPTASIDSFSGIVTGHVTGTVTITYTISGSTCYITETLTVEPLPAPIAGPSVICTGSTVSYTDAAGGTWSSSDPSLTIDPSTGLAIAGTDGVFTITLTTATGCTATKSVTVSAIGPITPTTITVCTGNSIVLSDSTPGGIWISADTFIAEIDSFSGILTGISSGTVTISYLLTSGCYVITSVSAVNPVTPILGYDTVCDHLSTILVDSTLGGLWESTVPGVATITSSGVVTGVSPGSTTIYYVLSTGCTASMSLYVWGIPGISQDSLLSSICPGTSFLLEDDTTGITPDPWSSSDGMVASISSTGVVTGDSVTSASTATITYTSSTYFAGNNCVAFYPITVYPAPLPIVALDSICAWGSETITATDATLGGVWSASVAIVESPTGPGFTTVVGAGAGAGTITYTMPTGCFVTKAISVDPLPNPITAASTNVCVGQTILLTESTTGGTYYTTDPTIATVTTSGTTGTVTGVAAGTVTIDYVLPTGCYVSTVITVNIDSPIIGPSSICFGEDTTFTDGVTGGTWSFTPTGVTNLVTSGTTTIGSTPYAYAVYSGTGTSLPVAGILKYTTGSSSTTCAVTKPVTVYPKPNAIAFVTDSVCGTDSVLFTDATIPGMWSTADSAIAYVTSSTGEVHGTWAGVGVGTTTITYTSSATGCYISQTVAVRPMAVILPDINLCQGIPATFYDTVAGGGGTWSLANPSATITDSSDHVPVDTAIITGSTLGAEVITYTTPLGCTTTLALTIYPQPAAIAGLNMVCALSTISLSDATSGGTWSSSNNSVATVTFTGVVAGSSTSVVTGVSAGMDTITYTMPSGCFVYLVVTVNAIPAAITGPHSVCGTDSILLSDITPGDTWSCTPSTLATINSSTGNLVAIGGTAGGVVTVDYTNTVTGCFVTYTVTVNPLSVIVGPNHICLGVPTVFTDGTSGGSWSSSATSTAVVGISTGVVTGVALGNAIISYVMPGTGCTSYEYITVNPTPAPITAPPYVCVGQTVSFTDATPGGLWSSHDTAISNIDSVHGVDTGKATGTVIITYAFGTGCHVITTIIVDPLAPITGIPATLPAPSAVCAGAVIDMEDTIPGGTWTSSSATIASVNPITSYPYSVVAVTGTGAVGGVATISYTLPSGCVATHIVTVNRLPDSIRCASCAPGSYFHICLHDSVQLTDTWPSSPPGVWSTSLVALDSFSGYDSGMVYGKGIGAAHITYTNSSTGCYITTLFVVDPIPDFIRGGLFNICVGATTTLYDSIPTSGTHGTWISGNGGIASASTLPGLPASGLITGTGGGTTLITYILPAGCQITHLFEVSPVVTPTIDIYPSIGDTTSVAGFDRICMGQVPSFNFGVTNEGHAPIYEWYKNGTRIDSSGTYSPYTDSSPATGDIIKAILISDAICTSTDSATDQWTITLLPNITDAVTISYSPAMPICSGNMVVFTATPTNGGSSPYYEWQVNGLDIPGANAPTYSYSPVNGDLIDCYMISSALCATPDPAYSNTVTATVNPTLVDTIHIYAYPDTVVNYYDSVSFTVEETNYGWTPSYQWYLNGLLVTGATDSVFTFIPTATVYTVYCIMTTSNPCTTPLGVSSNKVKIHIGNVEVPYVANGFSEVLLVPNPNRGTFSLKGSLNTVATGEVVVEITDILGKTVYKGSTIAHNGKMEMEVQLDDNIANGVYYLRLTSGDESDVRHFVLDR